MSLPDPQETPTLSIPDAGKLLGLDRSSAYRAANAGYIPTIQLGQRRRCVPTAALLEMLQPSSK